MKFSKTDILLILLLVFIGIGITLWIYLPSKEKGNQLTVKQNGSILMTLPLNKDTTQTITDENGNTNTFYIRNNTVKMSDSNCNDNTCVHTGNISQAEESIVCLPHRLVLQITSSDKNSDAPDAITH